jgi:hypothetical protein
MPSSEPLILLSLRDVGHAGSIEASRKGASESRRHVLRNDEGSVDLVVEVTKQGHQRFGPSRGSANDDDFAWHPLEDRGLTDVPFRLADVRIERKTTKGCLPKRQR